MIDKSTKELERALNPRKWDKELNDAWHGNIPDLQKAFDEIREIAKNRSITGDKMKHTIEIEGLPEGWEPVCYRSPNEGEYYLQNEVVYSSIDMTYPRIIVRKEQPRRIVLEETGEIRSNLKLNCYNYFYVDSEGFDKIKIFREIKENDLSLTNEEPKLSLSVDECRSMSLSGISMKIADFLKDK